MTETEWFFFGIAWWLSFAWILDYFGIVHDGFIVMSVILIVDYLFGIASAYILWESIESKKMWQWLYKKATRRLLPFIVAWALKRTWFPVDKLITAILWIIVFSEAYSVIWHIYSINTKEKLPEIDAFKMLIWKLSELFKGLVNQNAWKIDWKSSSDSEQKEKSEEK